MSLVQIDSPGLSKSRTAREGAANAARREKWGHLRPDSAMVYVENRCHLKCEHCYETETTHPTEVGMSLDDYTSVFKELADLGVLYLTLTGGEVFLRRDLLDIVAEARKRRFHITLFTSGTLLNEAKADRLAELKLNVAEVSIYSHDPEVHDRFTGIPGSHARTVRGIELLVERGIEVVAKGNITTFNMHHLDELIALVRGLGAEIQLNPIVKPRMDGDRSPERFSLTSEQLRRFVFNRPDLYPAFRKHAPIDYCNGEAAFLEDDNRICAAGHRTLSIGADGHVYACGVFASPAGSLAEASLETIWAESAQLAKVRETTFGKMNACGTCEVNHLCTPCMAYSEIESGDHRACTSTSKRAAVAVSLQIDRRVRAEDKMSGRALPIVGDRDVPLAPASSRPRLSAEP